MANNARWLPIPQDWTWIDYQVDGHFVYLGLHYGQSMDEEDENEVLVEWWNHDFHDAVTSGTLDVTDLWGSAWRYYWNQRRPAIDVIILDRHSRKIRGEWVHLWDIDTIVQSDTRRAWRQPTWDLHAHNRAFFCDQCGSTKKVLYEYNGDKLLFCSLECRDKRNRPAMKKAA